MKITPTQEKALKKLRESGEWMSAYDLKVGLKSLDGLNMKGLVAYKFESGYLAFPRTGIMWKATTNE